MVSPVLATNLVLFPPLIGCGKPWLLMGLNATSDLNIICKRIHKISKDLR